MCVYVCVCIWVYMCTCVYECLCGYMCVCVYVYICAYDINPNPDNISVPRGRALETVGMKRSCEAWHWKHIVYVRALSKGV